MAKPSKQRKAAITSSQEKPISEKVFSTSDFNFDKWFPFILAAFAFLLYANTLTHQYVLDDETVMAKNKIVTKGISAIPEILMTAYRAGSQDRQESLYRPLSVVMFAIEWQISPNKPFLGHLINVLLYALTGFLLYRLLRKWFAEKHSFVLFAITALFIAHPLHTEVVANIKSRDEILGMLFAILSLSAFYNFAIQDKLSVKYLLSGTLFFFSAMLSKESTVTLLAAIPLSLYFFAKQENNKKLIYSIVVLFIGVAAYFILRKIAIGGLVTFNEVSVLNNSLIGAESKSDRFATAIVLVGYYFMLFFFPHPLSFDYSLNSIPNASLSDIRFLVSIAIIIAMIVFALINIKKKNAIAFGILFFGITLSIVSNIFVIIEATLAERFMYLPSLGLCIAFILVLEKLTNYFAKDNFSFASVVQQNKLFSGLLFGVFILFSVKTITRNFDWKDNFTLFSVDKDHNPNSYRNLSGYANELYRSKILPLKDGDPQKIVYCEEAITHLSKSLAITPDNFSSWSLLTYSYLQLKDYQQAQTAFENGIKYYNKAPYLDNFYMLGANAYYYLGNINKALENVKAGISIADTSAALLNTYGMILTESNDLKNAKDAFIKSLQIDSSNADTWYNYGNWFAKSGDFITAIEMYKRVETKNASVLATTNAYNNTGNCYAVLKQYGKALEYFQKVLAFSPNSKDALRNISVTYTNLGDAAKAQEYMNKANAIP